MEKLAGRIFVCILFIALSLFATTYYQDYQNGSDGNGGTGPSDAKKTHQAGVDLMTSSGDWLLCTNGTGGAEPITADVDYDAASGADGLNMRVIGCNASFVADGTTYKIDASGSPTGGIRMATYYWRAENIEVQDCDGIAFYINQLGCTLLNCVATDADEQAVYCNNTIYTSIIGCKFYNWGSAAPRNGVYGPGTSSIIEGCEFIGGSSQAVYSGGAIGLVMVGNIIHGVTGTGAIYLVGSGTRIIHNTIDGCNGDAIYLYVNDRGDAFLKLNRVTNCNGYAVNIHATSSALGYMNAWYNNTSGETNGQYYESVIGADITLSSDRYEDVAGHDFTPTADDEASQLPVPVGLSATNITYVSAGAITPAASGSGSGGPTLGGWESGWR